MISFAPAPEQNAKHVLVIRYVFAHNRANASWKGAYWSEGAINMQSANSHRSLQLDPATVSLGRPVRKFGAGAS